jgi:hypothetical protein
MIKVIHVDDDGAEMAVIELDDFLVETLYCGIATMLHEAESSVPLAASSTGLSREARLRRERILTRIKS